MDDDENEPVICTLKNQLSASKYLHERTSGTFLGWLSDVGGLNDALIIIFSPLVMQISSLSFSLSVTNNMPVDTGTLNSKK